MSYKVLEKVLAGVPKESPMYFYHSRDDEVVPFEHLALYGERLPQAAFASSMAVDISSTTTCPMSLGISKSYEGEFRDSDG